MYTSTYSEKLQIPAGEYHGEETGRRSGTIYRASGNLLIIRKTEKTIPHNFAGTIRGAITEFSASSGQRMRRYLRECVAEYSVMVTLTYPGFFPSNGKLVKDHLRRFIQEVQREYKRLGHPNDCGYKKHSVFWFMEFQHRGAPHFHLFLTWSPPKEWVSRRWYEIVGSEDKRHLYAGTRTEFIRSRHSGTISYASKYAAKQEQKVIPEGYENAGRFWGVTGGREVLSASTFVNSTVATEYNAMFVKKTIKTFIIYMLSIGEAEIMIRKEGIFVLNIIEKRNQIKMRALVARLACTVMTFDSMFLDAELDIGEF